MEEVYNIPEHGDHYTLGGQFGRVVNSLASEPEGPGSSPETIKFLTNSSGQATNARVTYSTKQHKLVPAS